MDEIPKPEKQFKRIGRIAKGETIIVPMLSEDLQAMYDKRCILRDDADRMEEIAREEFTDETVRTAMLARETARRADSDFWIAVQEKYGHWRKRLGIRDGYAIVSFSQKNIKKELGGMIKKFFEAQGFEGGEINFKEEVGGFEVDED